MRIMTFLRRNLIACVMALATTIPFSVRAGDASAQTVGFGAEEIAKADNDFCKLSATGGARKAFDFYLTEDSINPSPDQMSALGKQEILTSMTKFDEGGLVLTWHPLRAETAKSGDFGYTYGPWEMRRKSDGKLMGKGFYTTIWKKSGGEWKAAFDMGNEATLEAK